MKWRGSGEIGIDDDDGAASTDAYAFYEAGLVCGIIVEVTSDGTYVKGIDDTCGGGYAGGGDPNTPVTLSPIATTAGFAAGHIRNIRSDMAWNRDDIPQIIPDVDAGHYGTDQNVSEVDISYSATGVLTWGSDDRPVNGVDLRPVSIAIDTSGAVYNSGALQGQSSQVDVAAQVRSSPLSATGAITAAAPAAGAGCGDGFPFWSKRTSAGLPVWAKGFGASSTYADNKAHPVVLTLVDDVPVIVFPVRVGCVLYLDEGLGSEVVITADSAPYPRACVAVLDPADGHVVRTVMINGENAAQAFDTGSSDVGNIKAMDGEFHIHPIDTTKIAVAFETVNTRITIGGTNLDPITAGKKFAACATIDLATGAVLTKKRYPSTVQQAGSTFRITSVAASGV